MIINRLSDRVIPIDILRLEYNRSLILPTVTLINGHGQIGKSTFTFFLANRIEQIKKYKWNWKQHKNEWGLWDWRNNSTTTPQNFVRRYDEENDATLNLSEAGEQMNYLEWYGIMSRVFASTTRTQGYKHNRCLLDTPMSNDITKHNKEYVDFKIWVRIRDDTRRLAVVRPRYVKIDYLKDTVKMGWLRDWIIIYTPDFLRASSEFTDWLKTYKVDIAQKNKELVGLAPRSVAPSDWY